MKTLAIFYPMVALAAWTIVVLSIIPWVRVRAALRREIVADDFKYGEAPGVPPHVRIPNRNYMNLLELPVLFYVVCLVLYVTAGASSTAVAVAWTYVALRIVHSLVHLGYNNVIHRLAVFSASNVALVVLWVIAALHVGANAGA